jgi:hypothetical protein
MMQGYHDRPTQLLPKEDVAVVIWGNKITDDISHPIRFHASKEVADSIWETGRRTYGRTSNSTKLTGSI